MGNDTRNQHFVPRAVLRGFLARKTKRDEYAWSARRTSQVFCGNIEGIGAARDFYSDPPTGQNEPTLDRTITDYETRLAELLRELRAVPIGASADSATAAEVIGHLTPRAASLRTLMSNGIGALASRAEQLFTSEDEVSRILGLKGPGPTAHFVRQMGQRLRDDPRFVAMNIPADALDRIAFALLRENLSTVLSNQAAETMREFEVFKRLAPSQISSAHRESLKTNLITPSRRDALQTLNWSVVAGTQAILPDCVAIAIKADGTAHPYIASDRHEVVSVALPLTPDKILIGVPEGATPPPLEDFNRLAAGCSDDFVVSATRNLDDLVELIGTTSQAYLDQSIDDAFARLGPGPTDQDLPATSRPSQFSFAVGFSGWGDEAEQAALSELLQKIITKLAPLMPLHRLQGVTFALDLAAALETATAALPAGSDPRFLLGSRGPGASYVLPSNLSPNAGFQILLAADYGWALLHQPDEHRRGYALHVLVEELAICAFLTELDERWPGFLFTPTDDTYVDELFAYAAPGLIGYVAARVSADFGGDTAIEAELHDLIGQAIRRGHDAISAARDAHTPGDDIEAFFQTHRSTACELLTLFGRLAGHLHGHQREAQCEGVLDEVLEALELTRWFELYAKDLARAWEARASWDDMSEIANFGAHLERLLWQLGVFTLRQPEGRIWVEPLPAPGMAPALPVLDRHLDSPSSLSDQ